MSERCKQTSERTSDWPSTSVCILDCSGPPCRLRPRRLFHFVVSSWLALSKYYALRSTQLYQRLCPLLRLSVRPKDEISVVSHVPRVIIRNKTQKHSGLQSGGSHALRFSTSMKARIRPSVSYLLLSNVKWRIIFNWCSYLVLVVFPLDGVMSQTTSRMGKEILASSVPQVNWSSCHYHVNKTRTREKNGSKRLSYLAESRFLAAEMCLFVDDINRSKCI